MLTEMLITNGSYVVKKFTGSPQLERMESFNNRRNLHVSSFGLMPERDGSFVLQVKLDEGEELELTFRTGEIENLAGLIRLMHTGTTYRSRH